MVIPQGMIKQVRVKQSEVLQITSSTTIARTMPIKIELLATSLAKATEIKKYDF